MGCVITVCGAGDRYPSELCGLKALRRYQRELQQDEKSLQLKPKHNWTSHYADAFRMLAVAWRHQAG